MNVGTGGRTPAFDLRVLACAAEAKDVMVYTLERSDGGALPPIAPGAHLELALPGGLVRQYSICGDPSSEAGRIRIGVALAPRSRGGSRYLHEQVRVGSVLKAQAIRNNFPLDAEARALRFIAGGIGITPILSMIRACVARRVDWSLLYCARNRQRAAFAEFLARTWPERVRFHFDDEAGGSVADFGPAVAAPRVDEHLYCCGPAPLMDAVRDAAGDWPEDAVHFEWFSPPHDTMPPDPASASAFTVVLRRTGMAIEVGAEQTILEALESRGIAVPCSCREGLCRSCETAICAGEADHRDFVLSQTERTAQTSLMVCVSRARTPVLELDL